MDPILEIDLYPTTPDPIAIAGQFIIDASTPVHAKTIKVYLEGVYVVYKRKKFGKREKLKPKVFIVDEHILWTTTALPEYMRSEGEYLRGKRTYQFVFNYPNLSTLETKYFTLTFRVRAELVTSTLIFNTFEVNRSIVLVPVNDVDKLHSYKQPIKQEEGPFTIEINSRILDDSTSIIIKALGSFKVKIKLIQTFQYETESTWKRKTKKLLNGDCRNRDQVELSFVPFKEVVCFGNNKNKSFKWTNRPVLTTSNNQQSAIIDHFLQLDLTQKSKYKVILPLMLLKL